MPALPGNGVRVKRIADGASRVAAKESGMILEDIYYISQIGAPGNAGILPALVAPHFEDDRPLQALEYLQLSGRPHRPALTGFRSM